MGYGFPNDIRQQCWNLRLIAGSIVLILGGGFWIVFWGSMGVMVADDPSATIVTYLRAVIPIAALGLIVVVVGVGQLFWK